MRTPAADPTRGRIGFSDGTWRSLVAHLHGVQGVASSNLAVPTNLSTNSNFPTLVVEADEMLVEEITAEHPIEVGG
jgi:hypothetical protein